MSIDVSQSAQLITDTTTRIALVGGSTLGIFVLIKSYQWLRILINSNDSSNFDDYYNDGFCRCCDHKPCIMSQ